MSATRILLCSAGLGACLLACASYEYPPSIAELSLDQPRVSVGDTVVGRVLAKDPEATLTRVWMRVRGGGSELLSPCVHATGDPERPELPVTAFTSAACVVTPGKLRDEPARIDIESVACLPGLPSGSLPPPQQLAPDPQRDDPARTPSPRTPRRSCAEVGALGDSVAGYERVELAVEFVAMVATGSYTMEIWVEDTQGYESDVAAASFEVVEQLDDGGQ